MKKNVAVRAGMILENPEDILDLIVCIQGRRMEEQRAHLILPNELQVISASKRFSNDKNAMTSDTLNEEHLYDQIISRQSLRLDDQRSELGCRPHSCSALPTDLPDEIAEMVIAMQAGRYESQRAHLKPPRSSDSDSTSTDGQQRCSMSASASMNINTRS